jgi:hypothetical protein
MSQPAGLWFTIFYDQGLTISILHYVKSSTFRVAKVALWQRAIAAI